MPSLFSKSELFDLVLKVEAGERLEYADGVRLMKSKDILALGYMANLIRERKHGHNTYFIIDSQKNHITKTEELAENPILANTSNSESQAIMPYGQEETAEDRISHLLKLRELQDKKGGFLSFTPLPVLSENNKLEGSMGVAPTTGFEDLKMLSIARILLDNFEHIKSNWIMLGPKLAQVSLGFGTDELEGMVITERGTVGQETEHAMTRRGLINLIKKARRTPIQVDRLYNLIDSSGAEGGQS